MQRRYNRRCGDCGNCSTVVSFAIVVSIMNTERLEAPGVSCHLCISRKSDTSVHLDEVRKQCSAGVCQPESNAFFLIERRVGTQKQNGGMFQVATPWFGYLMVV